MNYRMITVVAFTLLVWMTNFVPAMGGGGKPHGRTPVSFTLDELKQYLSNKSIYVVNLAKSLQKTNQPSGYVPQEYEEPKWETMSVYVNARGNETVMIDLECAEPLRGISRADGLSKVLTQEVDTIISKLDVRKSKYGQLMPRVVTYMPESRKSFRPELPSITSDESKCTFSGVVLFSTIAGEFYLGEKYENGKLLFQFTPPQKGNQTNAGEASNRSHNSKSQTIVGVFLAQIENSQPPYRYLKGELEPQGKAFLNDVSDVSDELYEDMQGQCVKTHAYKHPDLAPVMYQKYQIPNSNYQLCLLRFGGKSGDRVDRMIVADQSGMITDCMDVVRGSGGKNFLASLQFELMPDYKIVTYRLIPTSSEPILYDDVLGKKNKDKVIECYRINTGYSVNRIKLAN